MVKVISTDSLFLIHQITFEKSTHVIHQNTKPHTNIDKNDNIHIVNISGDITLHSKIIHSTTKNNATDVQSLKRLSHSNIKASLLGAHIDLKIEITATGSVADIKNQNNKHTKNGI